MAITMGLDRSYRIVSVPVLGSVVSKAQGTLVRGKHNFC